MNRFEHSAPSLLRRVTSLISPVIFIALFLFFLQGIQSVGETTKAKQLESLETALRRSISQCYAVEGAYPPSVDYLVDHYGLTYDSSTFLVDYDYYGGNLLPEVTVLRKTGK